MVIFLFDYNDNVTIILSTACTYFIILNFREPCAHLSRYVCRRTISVSILLWYYCSDALDWNRFDDDIRQIDVFLRCLFIIYVHASAGIYIDFPFCGCDSRVRSEKKLQYYYKYFTGGDTITKVETNDCKHYTCNVYYRAQRCV